MSLNFLAAIQRARASLNMPRAAPGRLWGRGASQITPRLYLSDVWTACDPDEMERLGVTHIISVIEHRPALPDCVSIQRRLQIFLADRTDANILNHLEETTKFIQDALTENGTNKVLVHCQQGISRSATVVCAYICATEGLDAFEAIEYVQERRSIICPNLGFRLQLVRYARPFVKEKQKSKTLVSEGIAQRIRSLFPEKATKTTVKTEEVVVVASSS